LQLWFFTGFNFSSLMVSKILDDLKNMLPEAEFMFVGDLPIITENGRIPKRIRDDLQSAMLIPEEFEDIIAYRRWIIGYYVIKKLEHVKTIYGILKDLGFPLAGKETMDVHKTCLIIFFLDAGKDRLIIANVAEKVSDNEIKAFANTINDVFRFRRTYEELIFTDYDFLEITKELFKENKNIKIALSKLSATDVESLIKKGEDPTNAKLSTPLENIREYSVELMRKKWDTIIVGYQDYDVYFVMNRINKKISMIALDFPKRLYKVVNAINWFADIVERIKKKHRLKYQEKLES